MIGTNAKRVLANLCGQMPIPQMPGQADKLMGVLVPDLNDGLGSRLDLQPSAIVQLQPIPVRHGNGFREIKKHIFAVIRGETDTPTVARVKVEGERAGRLLLWPVACRSM